MSRGAQGASEIRTAPSGGKRCARWSADPGPSYDDLPGRPRPRHRSGRRGRIARVPGSERFSAPQARHGQAVTRRLSRLLPGCDRSQPVQVDVDAAHVHEAVARPDGRRWFQPLGRWRCGGRQRHVRTAARGCRRRPRAGDGGRGSWRVRRPAVNVFCGAGYVERSSRKSSRPREQEGQSFTRQKSSPRRRGRDNSAVATSTASIRTVAVTVGGGVDGRVRPAAAAAGGEARGRGRRRGGGRGAPSPQ
jgi:hypothetical protein